MHKYFLVSLLLLGTIYIVQCQRSARQNQWGRGGPRPTANLFYPSGPPRGFGNDQMFGGFGQASGNQGFGQPFGNGGGFGQPSGNQGFGQSFGGSQGQGFGRPSGNQGSGQSFGNNQGQGFGRPFRNQGSGQSFGNNQGQGFGQSSGNQGSGQSFGNSQGQGFGRPDNSGSSWGSSNNNNNNQQWGRPGGNDRERRTTIANDWRITTTTFKPTLKAPIPVEHNPPSNCNCQAGPQYNPVCGSDGKTYRNRELLNCISNCSGGLTLRRLGACTTPSGNK